MNGRKRTKGIRQEMGKDLDEDLAYRAARDIPSVAEGQKSRSRMAEYHYPFRDFSPRKRNGKNGNGKAPTDPDLRRRRPGRPSVGERA